MTSLKEMFPEYVGRSPDELQSLWDGDAEISVDANVLLNLYRYREQGADELLSLLHHLRDRLWVSGQAALEFLRNRPTVIAEQRGAFGALYRALDEIPKTIRKSYQRGHHPTLEVNAYAERIEKYLRRVRKDVEEAEAGHRDLSKDDPILERLNAILEGRVGPPPTAKEQQDIEKEGQRRYKDEIPPGYKDAGKGGRRMYGDLVIWKQIIARAQETKRAVILVTDERKEDWWWEGPNGRTLGPRPELVREMRDEAGVGFHMYRTDLFMEVAAKHVGREPNQKAVREARKVRKIEARDSFAMSEMLNAERMVQDRLSLIWNAESLNTLALQDAYKDQLKQLNNMLALTVPAEWIWPPPGILDIPDPHPVETRDDDHDDEAREE